MSSCSVLCWNVRGLNQVAKRAVVAEVVKSSGASFFCCQESKLSSLDRLLLSQTCGSVLDGVESIPADGTRGGLFTAWRTDRFSVTCLHKGDWSLSLQISNIEGGGQWTLTNVYGPQSDNEKILFLDELTMVGQSLGVGAWCVMGDFNLLAAGSDKNNGIINRKLIGRFRCFLDALELREVYLFGRRYTWCNEQEMPTLTKIDKVLVNGDWEDVFQDAHLQALSSSASDHCPIILACDRMMHRPRNFKFESF